MQNREKKKRRRKSLTRQLNNVFQESRAQIFTLKKPTKSLGQRRKKDKQFDVLP